MNTTTLKDTVMSDTNWQCKEGDPFSPAQPDTAKAIHYPECWDVAAYPTLESALSEIGSFKCSECKPDTAVLQARIAEMLAIEKREMEVVAAERIIARTRIAELEARIAGLERNAHQATVNVIQSQIAAQAGQEHSKFGSAELQARIVAHATAPANSLAIVQACADEVERMMMFPGGRCESFAHHGVVSAATALRDNAQSIIDAASGK